MKFFVFILAVVSATTANAIEIKDRSYFFKCDRHSDCLIVEGACPGFTAINKLYKKEALEYWKSIMPYILCMPRSVPLQQEKDFAAYCNAKKMCDLKMK